MRDTVIVSATPLPYDYAETLMPMQITKVVTADPMQQCNAKQEIRVETLISPG
jgi:hypothetical protein